MHTAAAAPLAAWGKDGAGRISAGSCRRLGGVHVGFLLGLRYVLLVADPLVPEPVVHLFHQFNSIHKKLSLIFAIKSMQEMGRQFFVYF